MEHLVQAGLSDCAGRQVAHKQLALRLELLLLQPLGLEVGEERGFGQRATTAAGSSKRMSGMQQTRLEAQQA